MSPIVIDLFCGAGGMSEGLLQADFDIVFSSDINKDCMNTYTNRHQQLNIRQGIDTHFELADIKNLSGKLIKNKIETLEKYKDRRLSGVDAIFGGPPCQGFSRAGLRRKDDPRNVLFKEYIRVIKELKDIDFPSKYIVMENVEGFLDTRLDGFIGLNNKEYPSNTLVTDILTSELETIGYTCLTPQILTASDFGVPQRRRRVIFLAYLNGQVPPKYPSSISFENQRVTIKEAIGDLIINEELRQGFNSEESYYQRESRLGRTKNKRNGFPITNKGQMLNHQVANHAQVITERFSLFNQGETTDNLIKRLHNEGIDLTVYPNLLKTITNKFEGIYAKEVILDSFLNGQMNQEMIGMILTKKMNRYRLHQDFQSPTVLTLPDDYISPFENRILTVREMARLQSFDDSFEFLGKRTTGGQRRRIEVPQYTQVGNSVPPLLSKAIALEIKNALEKVNDTKIEIYEQLAISISI